jgi:dienelactone hydrolase
VFFPATVALLMFGAPATVSRDRIPSVDVSGPQSPGIPAVVSDATPPPNVAAGGVKWITVTSPRLGVMLAAVATPSSRGPFTTVVILHGSHGFAREYVQLAKDLADRGVQAMAPCWFSGSSGGAGSRFVTPIACPEAPPIPTASSAQALATVDALIQAARQLPGARPDRIALLGHSRGGGAALNYILKHSGVYAAILNSTGYPSEVTGAAAGVQAPILLLHGSADDPSDGGSARTTVTMARAFQEAVRRAGKPIDAHYYDAAGHNAIFTSETQRLDELLRVVRFLKHPTVPSND